MSKDFETPIWVYTKNPQFKEWFLKNNIIWFYDNWDMYIPWFKVNYERSKEDFKNQKSKYNNNFPFYHNMFLELIISLDWNWKTAMELFKKANSYVTNWWATVSLTQANPF